MNSVWLVVPLLVLVAVLLMAGGGRRSRDRALRRQLGAIEETLAAVSDKLDVRTVTPDYPQVVEELQRGRKINAIKAYRQATGSGLAEAKHAVEGIARRYGLPGGAPADAGSLPLEQQLSVVRRQADALAGHLGVAAQKPTSTSAGVLDELRRGRKIQAIKAYRMETGVGLAEAKDAVEDLARRHGL